MTATTYRQVCGSHLGLIAHTAADEPLCGECAHAELVRRVEVEAWPVHVRHPALRPISRRQAEQNLAVLMDAMTDESALELVSAGSPDPIEEAL